MEEQKLLEAKERTIPFYKKILFTLSSLEKKQRLIYSNSKYYIEGSKKTKQNPKLARTFIKKYPQLAEYLDEDLIKITFLKDIVIKFPNVLRIADEETRNNPEVIIEAMKTYFKGKHSVFGAKSKKTTDVPYIYASEELKRDLQFSERFLTEMEEVNPYEALRVFGNNADNSVINNPEFIMRYPELYMYSNSEELLQEEYVLKLLEGLQRYEMSVIHGNNKYKKEPFDMKLFTTSGIDCETVVGSIFSKIDEDKKNDREFMLNSMVCYHSFNYIGNKLRGEIDADFVRQSLTKSNGLAVRYMPINWGIPLIGTIEEKLQSIDEKIDYTNSGSAQESPGNEISK